MQLFLDFNGKKIYFTAKFARKQKGQAGKSFYCLQNKAVWGR